jgi:hypothetical protein
MQASLTLTSTGAGIYAAFHLSFISLHARGLKAALPEVEARTAARAKKYVKASHRGSGNVKSVYYKVD